MVKCLVTWCAFFVLSGIHLNIFAQEDSKVSCGVSMGQNQEIQYLKQRVRDLEDQNRAILKALERIEGLIAQRSLPESAAAHSKSQSTAQPNGPVNKTDEAVHWGDLIAGENRIRFYGALRVDLLTDNSRPDNAQVPFFILPKDSNTGAMNASNFTLHPRLTRLGVRYIGPAVETLGNSKLSGQFEVDFQNGGRESRQIIRIRHANVELTRGSFSFLAGQTWDVISPLIPVVNNDSLMWNTGNLGDRRPQILAAYEPKIGSGQFSFTGSIGLTGAIDALDLDNNGFRDGEESTRPNVQVRFGYAHASGIKGQKVSFGLWGHRGWERTSKPVAGRTEFPSQSLGLDYSLPLHERLIVRGELWSGRNLSDVRGGIGQGINATTGALIGSRGGWIEANFRAHKMLTITPGFTIDDPRDRDIPALGRTRNRAWYVAHRIDLGGGLLVGADYLLWVTDYKGLRRGTDNRFNLFLQYTY